MRIGAYGPFLSSTRRCKGFSCRKAQGRAAPRRQTRQ